MKPFNIFIILSVLGISAGFIFLKDALKNADPSLTWSDRQQLINRIAYLDYSDTNKVHSQKFGKTVLFFAATTWCQTCSELDKEIRQRIGEIPADLTILKVDYDNDSEMKSNYRVTQQHTLIVLDKKGNEIKRWIGGNLDLLFQEVEAT
ncbi:thioredoxin family protein [Candidatus Gottesmanbacteria bacterium]|nr:thioredoxin family protein [Candidatus Gottesmanbacteria bacterium]